MCLCGITCAQRAKPRWPPIQEWRRVPPRRLRTPESGRSTATRRTARPRGRITDQVFTTGRRRRRASTSPSSTARNPADFARPLAPARSLARSTRLSDSSSTRSLRLLSHTFARQTTRDIRPFSSLRLSSLVPFLFLLLSLSRSSVYLSRSPFARAFDNHRRRLCRALLTRRTRFLSFPTLRGLSSVDRFLVNRARTYVLAKTVHGTHSASLRLASSSPRASSSAAVRPVPRLLPPASSPRFSFPLSLSFFPFIHAPSMRSVFADLRSRVRAGTQWDAGPTRR